MVFDAATRERRIRQFEHYLGLMEHRALQLTDEDCFIIFSVDLTDEAQKMLGVTSRFVQFDCDKDGMTMDLPNDTLTPAEAQQAIVRIPKLRPAPEHPGNKGHNPLITFYAYHQARQAAEDIAYFFFDLWEVPVDFWIEVRAFEGGDDGELWEANFSMA